MRRHVELVSTVSARPHFARGSTTSCRVRASPARRPPRRCAAMPRVSSDVTGLTEVAPGGAARAAVLAGLDRRRRRLALAGARSRRVRPWPSSIVALAHRACAAAAPSAPHAAQHVPPGGTRRRACVRLTRATDDAAPCSASAPRASLVRGDRCTAGTASRPSRNARGRAGYGRLTCILASLVTSVRLRPRPRRQAGGGGAHGRARRGLPKRDPGAPALGRSPGCDARLRAARSASTAPGATCLARTSTPKPRKDGSAAADLDPRHRGSATKERERRQDHRDQGRRHRRRLPGPAAGDLQRRPHHRSRRARRPPALDLIAEVQQHLGDDRVRAVAMDSTDGLAAWRRRRRHRRRRSRCPSATARSAASGTCIGEPVDNGRSRRAASAGRSTAIRPRSASCRRRSRSSRPGMKVDRPDRAVHPRRQGRPLRRRRGRQDRADPGADPQRRPAARRRLGLRGRGRAHARGQRPAGSR